MKKNIIVIFVLLILTGSSFAQIKVNEKLVKANLEFLASDALEGREAATKGEQISSLYIAKEFAKYGVKPFGDSTTYFQNFELKAIKIDLTSSIKAGADDLVIMEDFAFFSKSSDDFTGQKKCVFAGYGITAEEYEYDDYADLDVKDKAVIIMMGEPYSENEEFFSGRRPSKHSQIPTKIENAMKRGAGMIIFLPESESQQNMYWGYLTRSAKSESLVPAEKDSKNPHLLAISYQGLGKLLKDEEVSIEEFKEALNSNEIPEPFEFGKELNFDIKVTSETKKLRNVVGIVEGSDPDLKNEYVNISAHFDHVGFNSPDEVFNGADDNGSGTVGVMEAARLFAEKPTKRSVVLCLFAAEEKGLIGSGIFTQKHRSMENTMANVNLDMIGRGSTDTLFCLGAGKLSSELEEIVKSADEDMDDFFVDLSRSNNRLFYQSDHYNFFSKGIPCMFLNDMDFTDLHKVSDEVEKINWEKLYKSVELTYRIVEELGNLDHKLKKDEKKN